MKIAARKYLCEKAQIKQKAVFDLDELYIALHTWFLFYGYFKYETQFKVMEQYNRIEVFWLCERKIDDYVKFVFEFAFTITGLKDVEVDRGGVKVKRKTGTLEFRITCYSEKDFKNEWTGSPLKENMREFYDKYFVKKRLNQYKMLLYDELKALFTEIRSFLHLHEVK